jgi:hypothetical protein
MLVSGIEGRTSRWRLLEACSLRRIFGYKREDLTGGRRRLNSEESHESTSPLTVRIRAGQAH